MFVSKLIQKSTLSFSILLTAPKILAASLVQWMVYFVGLLLTTPHPAPLCSQGPRGMHQPSNTVVCEAMIYQT